MPVPILWTVFHPARSNGSRTVIQRSERRLTVMEVNAQGECWSRSPRSRRAEDWESLDADFRWAMTRQPAERPPQVHRLFAELVGFWLRRIVEMPSLEREALASALREFDLSRRPVTFSHGQLELDLKWPGRRVAA